jgi:hypothetical protein
LYPFEGRYPEIRDDYFKQHHLMLSLSRKHDIPIWSFIQVCSFAEHVRIPTIQEIRWQINTSIAYGVKAIQYFTYFIPIEATHETFKGSMIDNRGNKTKSYDDVLVINQQVKPILDELLNKKQSGLITSKLMTYHIPTEDISENNIFKEIIGNDLLIGLFEEDKEVTCYVVNTNLIDAIDFKLILNKQFYLKNNQNEISCRLDCGEGKLLKIIKGEKPV